MNSRIFKPTTLIGGAPLLLASICYGQATTATSPVGQTANWLQDWANATAVEGDFMLPQVGDGNVVINQGRTIQVDSAITTVSSKLVIQNTNDGARPTAFLEINDGGSLTANGVLVSQNSDPGTLTIQGGDLTVDSGLFQVAENGLLSVTSGSLNMGTNTLRVDEGGTINVAGGEINTQQGLAINGGDFNISDGNVILTDPVPGGETFQAMTNLTSGSLNLTGGTFEVAGATAATDTIMLRGEINISGGTFSVIGGQAFGSGVSGTTFNILGDEADITIDRFNNATATRMTTFNFIFDETGVSIIKPSGGSYVSLAATVVTVDGSAYTGGPAVFELFDYSNVSTICPDVTITGLGTEGSDYTFEQSTETNSFTLTILTDRGANYEGWSGGFPNLTDNNPSLDFDGDGIDNALEYVYGTDPTVRDLGLSSPRLTLTEESLVFEFQQAELAAADAGANISVQYGSDLSGWTTAENGVDSVTIEFLEDDIETGIDLVIVKIPRSLAIDQQMFARLLVTISP